MKPDLHRNIARINELNLCGFLILLTLFSFISIDGLGQCVNPAILTLSSTSGNICGTIPVTVSGNTFSGSATLITIREDGDGTVSPTTINKSPFTFTYTPKSKDLGKTVNITITTNNPAGVCPEVTATYRLSVNSSPSAPHIGTITMPTCVVATGSVALSSLPSTGTWTLTRNPGAVTTTSTGTSTTLSGIPAGTFTFIVTSSGGCSSSASSGVVINAQPSPPESPVQTIDCTLGTGKAVIRITSPAGTGLEYRLDGGSYQSGNSFSNVANGNHSTTVRNSSGCTTTGLSFPVSCGCVNQPAVTLSGSSGSTCGTAPVTISGNTFGGSATSVTITENGAGTVSPVTTGTSPFVFTYTPSAGDAGNTITINVTTNNPAGTPCAPATVTYSLTVGTNPSAPVVGAINQPVPGSQTGSVVLNGLPESGTWTLMMTPGNVNTSGTGISKTISGLATGTYIFTVTNAAGCISGPSAGAVITAPPSSIQAVITNPLPVCFPSTADLTAPEVTSGSDPYLTFTYWSDAAAKIPYVTPLTATAGTYYIKCTSTAGLFIVKPVLVTLYRRPLANAGADQVLEYLFGTKMNTQLGHDYEKGLWSVISGTGVFSDVSSAKTSVEGLSIGENIFLWTVTNGVCPASLDTVIITVHDLVISTLITPNMDGRNDYFVLQDTGIMVKTAVVIFNRSGVQVYKNENYDNLWDGVDYKGNPLPDDTYFCIIKTGNKRTVSGYIVVRR
jgi:gliding motility-associated-like protein